MTMEGPGGLPISQDVFLAPSWANLETQESTENQIPESSFMFLPFLYGVPMLKLSFEKIQPPDGLRNVYSPLSNLKRTFLFLPREPTFGFHDEHHKDSSSQELSIVIILASWDPRFSSSQVNERKLFGKYFFY